MLLTAEMIQQQIRIDDDYKELTCPQGTLMRYGYEGFGYTARLDLESGEGFFVMAPNEFVQFRTLETFHIPGNVLGLFYPKSSYSRRGLVLATSPLEPGWSGKITMAWHNLSGRAVTLYNRQGIVQVTFWRSDAAPLRTYAGQW